MKFKKFLIILPAVFAMVAMLVSCHCRTTSPWPSKKDGAIVTTGIIVEGDPREGERLRIEFDRAGKCKEVYLGKEEEPIGCKGFKLKETFFCIEADEKHEANTVIYGEKKAYCGNVQELTNGADIQFKANPAAGNKKCKNVGGDVICY